MATFSELIKEYINVAELSGKIKALEAELVVLRSLQSSLGIKRLGRKPGGKLTRPKTSKAKRGKRGKVKEGVLAFLQKNKKGKAIEIANLTGLKVTSVHQTLFGLKKSGHVTQSKKRGSPFVLTKRK